METKISGKCAYTVPFDARKVTQKWSNSGDIRELKNINQGKLLSPRILNG